MNLHSVILILVSVIQFGLVSLALMGWGYKLTNKLSSKEFQEPLDWAHWGLIGLSFIVFLSAINVFFFHANANKFHLLILVPGVWFLIQDRKKIWRSKSKPFIDFVDDRFFLLPLGIFLFLFLKSILYPMFDIHDDQIFYLNQIKMIIDRSEMLDPFSFRRLLAYGSQSLAQTIFLLWLPVQFANIFEVGFANLLAIGLIYKTSRDLGVVQKKSGTLILSLIVSVYLLSEQFRENLASQSSGFVYLFSLIGIFLRLEQYKRLNLFPLKYGDIILFALLVSSYGALKGSLVLMAGLSWIVFLRYLSFTKFLTTGLLILITLIPYAWGMYTSSGSFFYPLMNGNAINLGVYGGFPDFTKYFFYYYGVALRSTAILCIPFFVSLWLFKREKVLSFVIISFSIIFYAAVATVASGVEMASATRYMFPVVSAVNICLLLLVISEMSQVDSNSFERWIFSIGIFAFFIFYGHAIYRRFDFNKNQFLSDTPNIVELLRADSIYSEVIAKIQSKTEPKLPIVVLINKPYLFDHNRNPILGLDQLGSAAPSSDFLSSERFEFESYLSKYGYKYFIFSNPLIVGPPYSWQRWGPPARLSYRIEGNTFAIDYQDVFAREEIFKKVRVRYIWMFSYLNELIQERKDLFANENYFLLKIK